MRKGAQAAIFTLLNTVRVGLAELAFVLLRMVEVLDLVMASDTCLTIGTLLFTAKNVGTLFRSVEIWYTSPVLFTLFVVVDAALGGVRLF